MQLPEIKPLELWRAPRLHPAGCRAWKEGKNAPNPCWGRCLCRAGCAQGSLSLCIPSVVVWAGAGLQGLLLQEAPASCSQVIQKPFRGGGRTVLLHSLCSEGASEVPEGASEVPAVPPPRHHYYRSRSTAHPDLPTPPRPAAWAGLGAASTSSIEGQTELQLRTGSEFPCSVWQPRFPAAWRGGGEAARLAAAHLFAPEPGSLIWFVSGILGSTGCPLG